MRREASDLIILDGPMGTELNARGVPTPLPGWSAEAIEHRPETVAEVHRSYAHAGATVHTTNTFRTKRRTFPKTWEDLARKAVQIARRSVPQDHRIAGSISPLEDCYEPSMSPAAFVDQPEKFEDPRGEHRELVRVLADEGVDLFLCETFPHPEEALWAVEEAVATGIETWVSFTPGPNADLLTPRQVADAAVRASQMGARATMVNCLPADRVAEYLRALREAVGELADHVRWGAYANAGKADPDIGWISAPLPARTYAELARGWVEDGATIVGGCCGTGPAHVEALARLGRGEI